MYFDKLSELGIKLRRRGGSEKTQCPKCSESRRNKKDPCLSVNITNGDFCCHNCGWKGNVRFTEKRNEFKPHVKPDQNMLNSVELSEKIEQYFKGRGISKNTLERFMIHGKEEWMPQTQKKERCIVFPYIRNTEIINAKFRDGAKNFKLVKDAELIFFGMQTLKGRHCAIITEGEIDCLSAFECGFANDYELQANDNGEVVEHQLGMYGVLSVPNGASKGNQRLDYLDNCSDFMIDIDEYVIATDNDEAGLLLKDELIRRFGAEKCRFVEYPTNKVVSDKNGNQRGCKDLNEVLIYLGKEKVVEIILKSKSISVSGIFCLEDVFPTMIEDFRKGIQLAPTTRFEQVDKYFRWKKGNINLITGYAGQGKTTFAIQLMLTKSMYDGWRWAIFSPENYPANDFYDDIVEMYVGKWLNKMSEEEYVMACSFINEHFFYVYPENDHDINSIHEKFRYLILKKGVDGVMIDPFNQLDKHKPYDRDDLYLSDILKDIKRFALLNAVCYNIIAHPKNPVYKEGKELAAPGMYDLAGGAMWGNKVDEILIYHRPNTHIDKNSPDVKIIKEKTKRRRTGGQNGEFEMKLLWSQKRFCDPLTNETPCDSKLAEKIKFQEKNGLIQDGGLLQDFEGF